MKKLVKEEGWKERKEGWMERMKLRMNEKVKGRINE